MEPVITEAQAAANQANALHSTGPRTPEGKERSAQNSRTHGMTSKAVLLPDEDEHAYTALVESTIADLAPQSEHERFLAVNVATTIWRRERMYRTEAASFRVRARQLRQLHPEEITSDDEARAWMLLDPAESKQARLILRYVTAAERAVEKAIKEYRQAIAMRTAATEAAVAEPSKPAPTRRLAIDDDEDYNDDDLMTEEEMLAFEDEMERFLAAQNETDSGR